MLQTSFQLIGFLLLMTYGIMQIYAGFLGYEYQFGTIWAVIAIIFTFMTRFPLIITIGSFMGALYVWDWHWTLAVLFAIPGLILFIPNMLIGILSLIKR